jgi:hypothetical protein
MSDSFKSADHKHGNIENVDKFLDDSAFALVSLNSTTLWFGCEIANLYKIVRKTILRKCANAWYRRGIIICTIYEANGPIDVVILWRMS